MKNRIFLFCLLAALAVSCVKEQQEVIQTITDDPVFYATIEEPGNPVTRVFADSQLRVLWNADDRVSIFNKSTYNRQYRFDGQDGDNSGSFKVVPNDDFVTSNPLDYVYSVYPYNENTKISNDGEITVYLPAEQSYREDSFGLGANTMIAITQGDELMFKNLCGYFAIKLYGDNVSVSSITLKGNNNELLAGKATVIAQTDAAPIIQMDPAEATKELTLTCATPVTLGSTAETATTFWFVIPPTTFTNGFTMTVEDDLGGSFIKTTSGSLEIKRNILKKSAALRAEMEDQKPQNIIYYTSTDGNIVTPYKTDGFGANIVSNKYIDGQGVITFDADVTSIGNDAFSGCNTLESIIIPQKVIRIMNGAFSYCDNLSSTTIPKKVRVIENGAFANCTSLSSIVVPESVTDIGDSAFSGCNSLTSFTVPKSVTSIGTSILGYCTNLSVITVDPRNTVYDSRGSCNAIIKTESNTLVQGCYNTLIPDSITEIGDSAFSGCTGLTTLLLPNGLIGIGEYAFHNCESLTSITIPSTLTSLGQAAFMDCIRLTSITLCDNLTYIPDNCFARCEALRSIVWPQMLSEIGEGAFYGCSFANCNYCLELPPTVSYIKSRAFNALHHLIMPSSSPISIEPDSFEAGYTLLYAPASMVQTYKTRANWSKYANQIKPISDYPSEPSVGGIVGEAVDLGLSVKWASWNIGASAPEEKGAYFAWGEINAKWDYNWMTYKWCNGTSDSLIKYNRSASQGTVDNITILDPEDDAAHVNWGGNWRMPTAEEINELKNNCTSQFTTENGILGYRITSNIEGYSDKSIFFPMTGYKSGRVIEDDPEARLWSSSLYKAANMSHYATMIRVQDRTGVLGPAWYRSRGLPIRPVCPKE